MKRTIPRLEGAARVVAKGELIGLPVRVVGSSDPSLVGLAGIVVDETLHTLMVRRVDGRESRIGKRESAFEFTTPRGPVRVVGAGIEFRPEHRTKKVK
ncbi:MAG: ribonuclease P protein subunit [Candidatus Thermoplasmatota archaeon]